MNSSTQDHAPEIKGFIKSVVNQRKRLIQSDRSRANKMQMLNSIQRIETNLNAYPYASNKKISGFFLRYKDEIRILIPGEGSSCHRSREEQYNFYLSLSEKLIES